MHVIWINWCIDEKKHACNTFKPLTIPDLHWHCQRRAQWIGTLCHSMAGQNSRASEAPHHLNQNQAWWMIRFKARTTAIRTCPGSTCMFCFPKSQAMHAYINFKITSLWRSTMDQRWNHRTPLPKHHLRYQITWEKTSHCHDKFAFNVLWSRQCMAWLDEKSACVVDQKNGGTCTHSIHEPAHGEVPSIQTLSSQVQV